MEYPKTFKRQAATMPTVPQRAELIPESIYSQFMGGAVTSKEKGLLPPGSFSMVQNMRDKYPGKKKRAGQSRLNSSADSTNRVYSLFQFTKGKKTERHFYAQMSDGDILEADTAPPVVSGYTQVYSGAAGQIKASWAVINDHLLYANGADQHQIYPGIATYVDRFIVVKDTGAIPTIPEKGNDYSIEVSDGLSTTYAVLDSLSNLAAFDCIFIKTSVPAKQFTWTLKTGKENVTASVGDINYWNGAWTDLAVTDNTKNATPATLAQSGTMVFTAPADIIPHYLFGECGFWYQFHLDSGDLDAEVEVTAVTFEADFQSIQNVWDGFAPNAIEIQFYISAKTAYYTFPGTAAEISSMAVTNDYIYFASPDPIVGFYVDVGDTPNIGNGSGTLSTIGQVDYWNGIAWADASETDGTAGLSKSGWITFARQAAVQPTQFNENAIMAYWYRFYIATQAASDDVIIAIRTMPYFDMADMGTVGRTVCAWKDRACYTLDPFPKDIYVSAKKMPLALNGFDFTILTPGDGRANPVTAMVNIYQELLVFQEERGTRGGCITLFQGGSVVANIGKSIISTELGTFNSETVIVVPGVLTSTETDEKVVTMAFFISRSGIFGTDCMNIMTAISDDIQNYFDPKRPECIRRDQGAEFWIGHDKSDNVLRVGLICGHTEDDCADNDTADWSVALDAVNSTITFDTDHYEFSSSGDTNEIFYIGGLTLRKGWKYRLIIEIKDGTETSEVINLVNLNGKTVESSTAKTTTASFVEVYHDFTATADTDGIGIRIPADLAGDDIEIKNVILQQYVYPVYSIAGRTWSFDTPAQNLSCMAEIEAGSGEVTVLQVAGGVDDGYIYRLNHGTNDVTTAIWSFTRMEFSAKGRMLETRDGALRVLGQAAGNVIITPYLNGIEQDALTKSMVVDSAGQDIKRWRLPDLQIEATEQFSLEIANAVASQDMYLLDLAIWFNQDETR